MLDAGLYDNTRRSREIMHRFAILRGIRAELDAGVSSGSLTPAAAAQMLVDRLGMAPSEAASEVQTALQDPGQLCSCVQTPRRPCLCTDTHTQFF